MILLNKNEGNERERERELRRMLILKNIKKSWQDKELREMLRVRLRFDDYICTDADHNFLHRYAAAWEKQNGRQAIWRMRNRYDAQDKLNKDKWDLRVLVITSRQPNLRSNLGTRDEAKRPPTPSSSVPIGNKERITDVGLRAEGKLESIKQLGYVINMNQ